MKQKVLNLDAEAAGEIELTGVWSHLACSDEPDHPANKAQLIAFDAALAPAPSAKTTPRRASSAPKPRARGENPLLKNPF